MAKRKSSTSTSAFGVSKRESHDASGFYDRFVTPEINTDSTVEPSHEFDKIYHGDARDMSVIPDNSVALVVTSPPYFAGKEYEEALGQGHIPSTYVEYLTMLADIFNECKNKLEPGGRIAINVANLGRKPYRSLSADIVDILQNKLQMLLRGEIVWVKARGSSGSCAWGSFQKPANPVLRDLTERIIIASKGRFDRARSAREREKENLPSDSSLWRDEFMEATTDVWEMPPESASRVGHPAPFPIDLPKRLIHLYTYYDDVVLDPFIGSGTTAIAAFQTGRHYLGFDTDETYVKNAEERIATERARLEIEPSDNIDLRISAVLLDSSNEDMQTRAIKEGHSAKELAEALISESGFVEIKENVKVGSGIEVDFSARDSKGSLYYFDVAGGFTSHRPGLKRADILWKTIGKAAVLHAIDPNLPFVIMTTSKPSKGSSGDLSLQETTGVNQPITDVIEILNDSDQQKLRQLANGITNPVSDS